MDNQAVPPSGLNYKKFIEDVNKKVEEVEVDNTDRGLLELFATNGWKVFKEVVDARIELLKAMIDPERGESVIDNDDSPAVIGQKYLIISFAIYQLRRALEIPEAVRGAETVNE